MAKTTKNVKPPNASLAVAFKSVFWDVQTMAVQDLIFPKEPGSEPEVMTQTSSLWGLSALGSSDVKSI